MSRFACSPTKLLEDGAIKAINNILNYQPAENPVPKHPELWQSVLHKVANRELSRHPGQYTARIQNHAENAVYADLDSEAEYPPQIPLPGKMGELWMETYNQHLDAHYTAIAENNLAEEQTEIIINFWQNHQTKPKSRIQEITLEAMRG